MICFPNAKINIGLRVIEKRPDGFHNIETVFYPIHGLYDCIEFQESPKLEFTNSGLLVDSPLEKNLCVKAWKLLADTYNIPPIHIHLHKHIPFGAGLGGGSADAAFLLSALNSFFSLSLTTEKLEKLALLLGSDCPFFIRNTPTFAEGRGEIFTSIDVHLKQYYIILANPNIHVSTALAYSGVKPLQRTHRLVDDFSSNPLTWKGVVENDFEPSVFSLFPQIEQLKETFYTHGAIYAAMSGSGSTVFGIFESETFLNTNTPIIWQGYLE